MIKQRLSLRFLLIWKSFVQSRYVFIEKITEEYHLLCADPLQDGFEEKYEKLKNEVDELQKEYMKIVSDFSDLKYSLIHQLNYEYITYGQMLSLVQEDILAETDISDLLAVYGDNRDYEWYSEDCIGTSISENTKLKIEDILEMAEPVFSKILGL